MSQSSGDQLEAARVATSSEIRAAQQMIEQASRVYVSVRPGLLSEYVRSSMCWVTGDPDAIDGFMMAEMRPFSVAAITAAVISNGRGVGSYIDALLPLVEHTVQHHDAAALVHVGYAPWLTHYLSRHGFVARETVVTYGWDRRPVTVAGNRAVTVRAADHPDLVDVVALDRRIFGPVWHKRATEFENALNRAFDFSVAEWNGQIVGYRWSDKSGDHGHLSRLAVRPAWEGRGVGTRLLTETLVAMVNAGVAWITLNTQEDNLRSRMLYERHGFRLVDHRVAVLWKDLS